MLMDAVAAMPCNAWIRALASSNSANLFLSTMWWI
jgi:hypothetical protein